MHVLEDVFQEDVLHKSLPDIWEHNSLCHWDPSLYSIKIRFAISIQLLTVLSNFRTSRKLHFIRHRYIIAII